MDRIYCSSSCPACMAKIWIPHCCTLYMYMPYAKWNYFFLITLMGVLFEVKKKKKETSHAKRKIVNSTYIVILQIHNPHVYNFEHIIYISVANARDKRTNHPHLHINRNGEIIDYSNTCEYDLFGKWTGIDFIINCCLMVNWNKLSLASVSAKFGIHDQA